MTEQKPQSVPQTVKTRRVFYIHGYDPIHPRRYRELYRKESAAQAVISGYDIALKPKQTPTHAPQQTPRETKSAYGWRVTAEMDGQSTVTDIEVLVWSDIVRESMELGVFATYMQLVKTAWCYIGSGSLWRLMRLRKGPVVAALYPVIFLIVQLCLALGLAVLLGAGLALFLPPWTMIFGLLVVPPLLTWFKTQDNRFLAYYLMHDYAYSASTRGANPPELEARMAEFGQHIGEALAGDADEVLIVGHSSGAHLAVSVISDLIKAGKVRPDGPVLGFLSLGQVVPMVSFLPEAHRLRADLGYLCQRENITWVDVSAPGDGCAFALCDPVSVSGVAPLEGKRWPLVLSAAFTQTLSPARWKELRWKFFRLHFQYLCAFDAPGDYDYFKITAGPITLGERFAERSPSMSRIETPVNKFTSVKL